jgi:hypothetical protein
MLPPSHEIDAFKLVDEIARDSFVSECEDHSKKWELFLS